MHVVRKDEGKWKETPFPGVSVKRLFLDRETRMATVLMRIQPGAAYPPHHHKGTEQCLVLEGDVQLGSTRLTAGDYTRNDALSDHGTIRSEAGCLLMLMASIDDELL
jgi:anti-sigma factor ChrR (cupin superfamily)